MTKLRKPIKVWAIGSFFEENIELGKPYSTQVYYKKEKLAGPIQMSPILIIDPCTKAEIVRRLEQGGKVWRKRFEGIVGPSISVCEAIKIIEEELG